ncbi:MAG: hypothetical protein NC396_08935, partial [Bacteroides sp.]|nr:hypothetical protein [Bacteroides sp.]
MFSLLSAQTESVYRAWGKSIGKAQTDRDFLIYDALCPKNDTSIYIVGKAENEYSFELKQGENTYFHEKDSTSDAFLACYSLDGELLWSTYLPVLDAGYYNAFATTVMQSSDSSILVVVNSYAVQGNLEKTKQLIPGCTGGIDCFEINFNGKLLRSKSFASGPGVFSPDFLPRLFKGFFDESGMFYLSGICYWNSLNNGIYTYSLARTIRFRWNEKDWTSSIVVFIQPDYNSLSVASYHVSSSLNKQLWDLGLYNTLSLLGSRYGEKQWKCTREPGGMQSTDTFFMEEMYSRGIDLLGTPALRERWTSVNQARNYAIPYYYADPTATINNQGQSIYPGTVQNAHSFNGKFLVQGIHCRNYDNRFFKKDGKPYAYSHETEHLIPQQKGFYQSRNNGHTTVPYLLLYDSATFFGTIASNEDSRLYDFQPPLWGSYLNADWFYEDFFHVTDSAYPKDIYQPYEPILCSSGNRFFLIGNARNIDPYLIDNPTILEEYHHQGVILAFSMGCPAEKTTFQDVRFLCPGDSVELKVSPEYAGFKFQFEDEMLDNGSVVLNADSTRAWAKQEGSYVAVLDGSSLGCPDARTDTVQISLSPYPEPVSGMPDTA